MPINRQDFFNTSKGIMHRLESPLEEEFKDGDFTYVSGIFDYIPYMDNGDATLRVVRDLSKLSPTQSSCVKTKMDYATAGGLGFQPKADSIFKRQNNREQVITDAQHNEYAAFLTETINAETLLHRIVESGKNALVYGNFVLEVVLTQTAGYRGGAINTYDSAMFRYKREMNKGDISRGYIAQRWDFGYISMNKEKVVEYAMYPAFSQHKDGTIRTLIHVKNPSLYQNWYGLPDSFSSIYFQFMEFQLGKYTTRGYENLWLPSAFIETYDMPLDTDAKRIEEEMQKITEQLANVYTNRGDGKKLPIVFRQSYEGATPSQVVMFDPKTNEAFHESMSSVAEKQILKAHGWHRSLIEKTAGSIGNNSENNDIAKNTDKTVIKPLQEFIVTPYRKAIKAIEEWVGYKNQGLVIDLKSAFEDEATIQTAQQTTPPATTTPPQQPQQSFPQPPVK